MWQGPGLSGPQFSHLQNGDNSYSLSLMLSGVWHMRGAITFPLVVVNFYFDRYLLSWGSNESWQGVWVKNSGSGTCQVWV